MKGSQQIRFQRSAADPDLVLRERAVGVGVSFLVERGPLVLARVVVVQLALAHLGVVLGPRLLSFLELLIHLLLFFKLKK